eukprot:g45863.t1
MQQIWNIVTGVLQYSKLLGGLFLAPSLHRQAGAKPFLIRSQEERMALDTAIQHGVKKEQAVTDVTMDVSLDMHVPENVLLGTNFIVDVELQNNSNEKRSMTVFLSGNVVFYTGVPKIEIKKETIKVTVEPNQVHRAQVRIKSKDYVDHLVEQSILHFFTSGHVDETGQTLVVQKAVPLLIPRMNMRAEGPAMFGHEVTIVIEFTNPLRKPLEHLVLRIDGLDSRKPKLKLF